METGDVFSETLKGKSSGEKETVNLGLSSLYNLLFFVCVSDHLTLHSVSMVCK